MFVASLWGAQYAAAQVVPTYTANFTSNTLNVNQTAVAAIAIQNTNAQALTGISVTALASFPAGWTGALNSYSSNCVGVTQNSTTSIAFSVASVPANSTCNLYYDVVPSTTGTYAISGGLLTVTGPLLLVEPVLGPGSLTVSNATPQTIAFTSTPPNNVVVGSPNYTVTATGGGSGNPVTFSVDAASSAGACSMTGSVVSFTGQGICIINANQPGNTYYDAAPTAEQYIPIGQAAQVVTFTSSISNARVGGSYIVSASGGASGNAVTFSIDGSSTAGACTISGSTVTFTGVGTCVIDANQAGSSNYSAATQISQSVSVGQGLQVISYTSSPPGNAAVGGSYIVSASGGGSGISVVFSIDASSTTGACGLSGSTVTFYGAGTCVIDANQGGNANYSAAAQTQQSWSIGKASQTIVYTSSAPSGASVGGASYTVSASGGASGQSVTFSIDAASTAGACTIAGSTVSFTGAGTCIIDANQAGNVNYNAATQVQQSVGVGKATQSIGFTSAPPTLPVIGSTYILSASGGGSGLSIVFTIDVTSSSGACTISGSTVTFTGAGTCLVDANQAGNGSYNAAPQVQQSVVIGKSSQTILITSATPLGAKVGGTYIVTATGGGSGVTVVFSIDVTSSSGACTISGSTVSFTGAGNCVIDVNEAGNNNYNAATQVQQTVVIGQATQTVVFTSTPPSNETVGGAVYVVSATGGASGNPVVFYIDVTSTAGACALSGSTVSFLGAGTCVVGANQSGNANYAAGGPILQSITVGKGSQAIAFTSSAPSGPSIGAIYTVSATGGGSGAAVVFSIDAASTAGACTISGSTVTFTGAGTCLIDANQSGNANYNAAAQVQQSMGVGKGPQVIAFASSPPNNASVGGSGYVVSATGGASGNPVTFAIDALSTVGACTVAGSTVSYTGAGTCIVDANQAGNAGYSAASQAQQAFAIGKGAQAITFTSSPPGGAAVGGAGYNVSASSGASGVAIVFTIDVASTAGACAISGSNVSFTGAGTCIVDANEAGNANYNAAIQIQQAFGVGQGTQTIQITSTPPANAAVGSTYSIAATGGLSGNPIVFSIDATSTSGACTISGSTVSFSGAGSCVIDANQAGNVNYAAAAQVQQAFGVGAGSQSIGFTSAPPTLPAVGTTYVVTATGGASGVAIVFSIDSSSSSGACTISGSTVTFTGAGTCIVDANQAGNGAYSAAPQVQQSIAVGKANQTIGFTSAPPTQPAPGATYTVTASAGASGVAVTFAIDVASTAGACTISGSIVTFTGSGTCIVDANEAGNANYNAAAQIQQSIGVGTGAQIIVFTSTPPASASAGGSTYTVSATGGASGNAIVFSIDTASTTGACTISGATVSFTGGGTCVVDANQAGNANYSAATQVQQAILVGKAIQTIVFTSTAPTSPAVNTTYNVSATGGGSGLAVTFAIDASSTAGACKISVATVTFTGGGTCVIDANQAGNASYNAAAQVQQSIAVGKIATTATGSVSQPVIVSGTSVTLKVTISAGSAATGTVTFTDAGTALGTATVVNGVATLSVSSLPTGSQSITFVYSGDANYAGSSGAIAVLVQAVAALRLDTNVGAVVNAQVQAGQRYMRTQTNNVFRRLEQMHDESDALRGGIDDPAQSGLGLRGADSPGGYGGSDYALRGTDGTYPGQPQLPTRKGPSPQSLAVGRLSSTLPGAMAALDSKGLLPFHIWADGSMEFGNQQANGLYSNRFSTDGLTVGADGTLFRNFKGGLAFGFGFDQSDVGSDGSNVKSASYNATAYGSYKFARSTYLDMFVGMGRVNFDTNRWSSQGNTTLASNRSGTEAYGSIALTQDIRFGGAKVAPYGRLDASWLALGSATESGSSAYAMTYQGMAVSTLSGVLGTRLSWSQAMAWGLISPQLRVEYRHDFNGAYDQALYFANVGGAQSASVAQGAIGQDAYTLGLGLDAAFAHGAGVSVEYDYAGSASTQSQTVRLTARQAF